MSQSIAAAALVSHPVLPDIGRPVMAKANVRTPDTNWNELIGAAIQRAVLIVGWSNKEAAAKVGADDGEFGKWLNGTRRPQFDKLLAVPELRWPLVVMLGQITGEAEVITTLRKVG